MLYWTSVAASFCFQQVVFFFLILSPSCVSVCPFFSFSISFLSYSFPAFLQTFLSSLLSYLLLRTSSSLSAAWWLWFGCMFLLREVHWTQSLSFGASIGTCRCLGKHVRIGEVCSASSSVFWCNSAAGCWLHIAPLSVCCSSSTPLVTGGCLYFAVQLLLAGCLAITLKTHSVTVSFNSRNLQKARRASIDGGVLWLTGEEWWYKHSCFGGFATRHKLISNRREDLVKLVILAWKKPEVHCRWVNFKTPTLNSKHRSCRT